MSLNRHESFFIRLKTVYVNPFYFPPNWFSLDIWSETILIAHLRCFFNMEHDSACLPTFVYCVLVFMCLQLQTEAYGGDPVPLGERRKLVRSLAHLLPWLSHRDAIQILASKIFGSRILFCILTLKVFYQKCLECKSQEIQRQGQLLKRVIFLPVLSLVAQRTLSDT